MKFSLSTISFIFILSSQVSAHGAITYAVGDAGGKGTALGINSKILRNGTTRDPFQHDTTVFGGQKKGCGSTIDGGQNNITKGTSHIIAEYGGKLPQVSVGGMLAMTLHQINADGAGPYTCMLNSDGTANTWTAINITTQVPGKKGISNAAATDFPLVAQMPGNLTCNGTVAGQTSVCIVRCQNPIGPFGGCVPVQVAAAPSARRFKRFARMFLA